MTGGFEAVPDELDRMANSIADAVGEAAGMVWHQPGGDYGDIRVSDAWSRFLDELHDHVSTLHNTAMAHGDRLRTAATRYRDTDVASADQLNGSGIPGGGWAGGVNGVGDGPTGPPVWTNPGFLGSGYGVGGESR